VIYTGDWVSNAIKAVAPGGDSEMADGWANSIRRYDQLDWQNPGVLWCEAIGEVLARQKKRPDEWGRSRGAAKQQRAEGFA